MSVMRTGARQEEEQEKEINSTRHGFSGERAVECSRASQGAQWYCRESVRAQTPLLNVKVRRGKSGYGFKQLRKG